MHRTELARRAKGWQRCIREQTEEKLSDGFVDRARSRTSWGESLAGLEGNEKVKNAIAERSKGVAVLSTVLNMCSRLPVAARNIDYNGGPSGCWQ